MHPSEQLAALTRGCVLGRDASCSVVLEGKETSRQHAEIDFDGPLVTIRDLGSRNGTHVNGRRVERAPLVVNDVIRCGEWIGIVGAESAPLPLLEIAPGWFGGAALQRALAQVRGAHATLAVIIEGETGTGKEGAARAVHAMRQRRGPLIAVNCATLPMELAESELFGHRRGAFTGADQPALGYFRSAEGGTLFLDEVLELPLQLQPKLLRAIEQREIVPVGETKPIQVDVSIVAASQEPMAQAVRAGRFRADLYARLNGLTVTLPPLRERREEILPLTRRIVEELSQGRTPALCHKFVEALCVYDWPMNLRELVQLLRRLLTVYGQEPMLRKGQLPTHMHPSERAEQTAQAARPPAVEKRAWRRTDDAAELEQLIAALKHHQGSVARAAAALGIQRNRAYRLLAAHPEVKLSSDREQDCEADS